MSQMHHDISKAIETLHEVYRLATDHDDAPEVRCDRIAAAASAALEIIDAAWRSKAMPQGVSRR